MGLRHRRRKGAAAAAHPSGVDTDGESSCFPGPDKEQKGLTSDLLIRKTSEGDLS